MNGVMVEKGEPLFRKREDGVHHPFAPFDRGHLEKGVGRGAARRRRLGVEAEALHGLPDDEVNRPLLAAPRGRDHRDVVATRFEAEVDNRRRADEPVVHRDLRPRCAALDGGGEATRARILGRLRGDSLLRFLGERVERVGGQERVERLGRVTYRSTPASAYARSSRTVSSPAAHAASKKPSAVVISASLAPSRLDCR